MLFYLVGTKNGEINISAVRERCLSAANGRCLAAEDKFSEEWVLSPGLPFGLAQQILSRYQERSRRDYQTEIIRLLQKMPDIATAHWHWEKRSTAQEAISSGREAAGAESVQQNAGDETDPVLQFKDLNLSMAGRQFSEADLQRLAKELGKNLTEVINFCELQVECGAAEWLSAVIREGRNWRCLRCGETKVEEWPSIYGISATCPSCEALGALSSLQALYRSYSSSEGKRENNSTEPAIIFSPRWELSEAQERASREVLNYVSWNLAENKQAQEGALLWAACGAGKTEVCFPAVQWALERGQRVLFAAPRQDVVLDVEPRLKQDFPNLALSVLTGNSAEHFTPAGLVLATTHQVLRFYRAFDLIFMDEMDAFPYHGNSALAWGLQQALKPGGRIIYLTATPSKESLAKVGQGRMDLIRLPARHHRKALPVPEWVKFGGDFEWNKSPNFETDAGRLAPYLNELSQAGPVLLFVPKISWVKPWVEALCKRYPQWEISGSYSSDPERRGKIEGLRKQQFQVFVSTSILERGVTLPNAQVLVLAADHEIFDERALIQMAGRVGRTPQSPHGRAIFAARKKTEGIEKAIRWIEEQNALALELGLIDTDTAR